MSVAEQPDVGEQPGVPPLARTTLDRSAHRRRDAAWLADAWKRGLVLVVDITEGGRALVRDRPDGSAGLVLLDPGSAPEGERLFLGVDPDGTPLLTVDAPLPEIEGARPVTLRDIGHLLDDRDAGIFTAAAALANWHATPPLLAALRAADQGRGGAAGPGSTRTASRCGRVPTRR